MFCWCLSSIDSIYLLKKQSLKDVIGRYFNISKLSYIYISKDSRYLCSVSFRNIKLRLKIIWRYERYLYLPPGSAQSTLQVDCSLPDPTHWTSTETQSDGGLASSSVSLPSAPSFSLFAIPSPHLLALCAQQHCSAAAARPTMVWSEPRLELQPPLPVPYPRAQGPHHACYGQQLPRSIRRKSGAWASLPSHHLLLPCQTLSGVRPALISGVCPPLLSALSPPAQSSRLTAGRASLEWGGPVCSSLLSLGSTKARPLCSSWKER